MFNYIIISKTIRELYNKFKFIHVEKPFEKFQPTLDFFFTENLSEIWLGYHICIERIPTVRLKLGHRHLWWFECDWLLHPIGSGPY